MIFSRFCNLSRCVAIVVGSALVVASRAQTFEEMFRYDSTVPGGTMRQAFDQTGHVALATNTPTGQGGPITHSLLRLTTDASKRVDFKDTNAVGSEVRFTYSTPDGGTVVITRSLNKIVGVDDTTYVNSWPADHSGLRTLTFNGGARATIDPSGFIIVLREQSNGLKAFLERYDSYLVRDWYRPVTVGYKAPIENYDLATDSNGNIYAGAPLPKASVGMRVYKFTPDGSPAESWGGDASKKGFRDLGNATKVWLVPTVNGGVYVALLNSTSAVLRRLNPAGNVGTRTDGSSYAITIGTGRNTEAVTRIDTDRFGNAYVALAIGQVKRYSFRGELTTAPAPPDVVTTALANATDPQYLYRSYISGNGDSRQAYLQKYEWATGKVLIKQLVAEKTITNLLDLDVDPGGNVALSLGDNAGPRLFVFSQQVDLQPQVAVQNGTFSAKDRSVYSPTVNDVNFNYNIASLSVPKGAFGVGRYYTPRIRIRVGFIRISFSLGQFGGYLNGNFGGKVSLTANVRGSLGSFNVNYPITLTVKAPSANAENMIPGQPFKVNFSYTPDSTAAISTNPAGAYASLTAGLALDADAHLRLRSYGHTLFDNDLFKTKFDIKKTLIDTSSFLSTRYDYEDTYLKGYAQLPQIRAQGGLGTPLGTDYTLKASGSDVFFSLKAFLTDYLLLTTPFRTVYYGAFDEAGFSGEMTHRFVQATGGVTAKLRQDFKFDPGLPQVTFTDAQGNTVPFWDAAGQPQTSIAIDQLGTDLTFMMPTNANLQIRPSIKLPNARFTNTTAVVAIPQVGFVPYSGYGSLDAGNFNIWSDSWEVGTIQYDVANFTHEIASPSFLVTGLGTVSPSVVSIQGHQPTAVLPSVTALSRKSMDMFLYNQEQVGQPANYSAVRRKLERYITATTKMVVYGRNFRPDTTHFYMRHLGLNYEFTSTLNSGVAGGLDYINPSTVVVDVPNWMTVLAGNAQIRAVDTTNGESNSFDFPVVNPFPNVSTVGPNLWASDPQVNQVYVTVTDAGDARGSDSFLARRDYYYQLDRLWTDIFANYDVPTAQKSIKTFFPAAKITDSTTGNFVEPVLPTLLWDSGSGPRTLFTYGEPVPSGLLWAALPNDYLAKAANVTVGLQVAGPGGGTSAELAETVAAPKPVIASLSPSTIAPGSDAFTLILKGPQNVEAIGNNTKRGNFNPESVILLDGKPVDTAFISSSQLEANIPASLVATDASISVTVKSPDNGTTYFSNGAYVASGGTSAAATLTVANLVPSVSSISPSVVSVGAFSNDRILDDPFPNLSVAGTGFAKTSQIYINGAPIPTNFESSELLTTTLGGEYSTSAKSYNVTVRTPGVTTSNTLQLLVTPAVTVSTASVSPSFVVGGRSSTLTITAVGTAPGEGIVTSVTSSDPTIIPDLGTVIIPGGQMSVTKKITPKAVTKETAVILTVTQEVGSPRTVKVTIEPNGVISLKLTPNAVDGGESFKGLVTLATAAPKGGVNVALSTNNPLVKLPTGNYIHVNTGKTTAEFTCVTTATATTTNVDITATYLKTTRTATVKLNAPVISELSFSPNPVIGGNAVTGTVTLSQAAPAGGFVVTLQSDDAATWFPNMPNTVTIPEGQTSITFTFDTAANTTGDDFAASIQAIFNGVTTTESLTIGIS